MEMSPITLHRWKKAILGDIQDQHVDRPGTSFRHQHSRNGWRHRNCGSKIRIIQLRPRAATYFSAKFRSSKLLTFIQSQKSTAPRPLRFMRWLLMSAPDYFHWAGGRRHRTEDPVARLRYGGARAVGVAHFAHGFLRRLHFFLL